MTKEFQMPITGWNNYALTGFISNLDFVIMV
jgi:hypothetical protein